MSEELKAKTRMNMSLFGASIPQQRSFPTSATHNFYIYGPIRDLAEYVDMITILDMAMENDIINIYINTPGGELNTAISIIHAMLRSRANIITHADGEVASAGTLLFFAAPLRIVYPYSHFMFHDASGGPIGKINENMKNIAATSELIQKLCYDLYLPAFDEDEVDMILEGRDYYCDAEEMYDRINDANEKILAEAEAEEQEEQPAEQTEQLFTVDNPELKTHGLDGTIKEECAGGTSVVLELTNGKTIKIKRSNLKEV